MALFGTLTGSTERISPVDHCRFLRGLHPIVCVWKNK